MDLRFDKADDTTLLHLTSSQQLTAGRPIQNDLGNRRFFKLDSTTSEFQGGLTPLPVLEWPADPWPDPCPPNSKTFQDL